MKQALLLLFFALASLPMTASDHDVMIERLDSFISQRASFSKKKEHKLDALKRQVALSNDAGRLKLYGELYKEYYTYSYDSAMVYVRREYDTAVKQKKKDYQLLALIHRAMLMSIGGYYYHAKELLDSVGQQQLPKSLLYDYHYTFYWLYAYLGDYSKGSEYSKSYSRLHKNHLHLALQYYPNKHSAQYYYLLAENIYYNGGSTRESTKYYLEAIRRTTVDTRVYASSTYSIARNYKLLGEDKEYEYWLIRAAISDQVCPLKENAALQELAVYLLKKDKRNAKLATKYIYCSMEDAQFYNNRLRMLEISRRLPTIVQVYQKQIENRQKAVSEMGTAMTFLALLLIIGIVFIYRQNGKLNKRGKEIDENNRQLAILNERLKKTDATRGKYMRLFMDLCANYIGKLNDYRKFVARKIKVHQVEDLLHSVQSVKLSDQEAAEFYSQFDRAFMELYPTFLTDINTLLKPDCHLEYSREGGLTTELRIYALVRLGVTESAEIATLLFYSPQTIYNYRTSIRKRAFNPVTFEEDVEKLN